MPSKNVVVGSAIGLHARPAAIIAEAVVNAGVPVTLSMDGGEPVDAGSALMIMTLGAGKGAEVTVESEDEGAMNTSRTWWRRTSTRRRGVTALGGIESGTTPHAGPIGFPGADATYPQHRLLCHTQLGGEFAGGAPEQWAPVG